MLPSRSVSGTCSSHEATVQKKTSEVLPSFNKQHNGFFMRNPVLASTLVLTLFPVVKWEWKELELDLLQHMLSWLRNLLALQSELCKHCQVTESPGWTTWGEIFVTVLDFSPVGQTVTTKIISCSIWKWTISRFSRLTVHIQSVGIQKKTILM